LRHSQHSSRHWRRCWFSPFQTSSRPSSSSATHQAPGLVRYFTRQTVSLPFSAARSHLATEARQLTSANWLACPRQCAIGGHTYGDVHSWSKRIINHWSISSISAWPQFLNTTG
jgi:hypothetical protein